MLHLKFLVFVFLVHFQLIRAASSTSATPTEESVSTFQNPTLTTIIRGEPSTLSKLSPATVSMTATNIVRRKPSTATLESFLSTTSLLTQSSAVFTASATSSTASDAAVPATATDTVTKSEDSTLAINDSDPNAALKTFSIIIASCCFVIGITFFVYFACVVSARRNRLDRKIDIQSASQVVHGVFHLGGKAEDGHLEKIEKACSFENISVKNPERSLSSSSKSTNHEALISPLLPVLLKSSNSLSSCSTSGSCSSEQYDAFDTNHHYERKFADFMFPTADYFSPVISTEDVDVDVSEHTVPSNRFSFQKRASISFYGAV